MKKFLKNEYLQISHFFLVEIYRTMEIEDIKKWLDDIALLNNIYLNGSELYVEVSSFYISKIVTSLKTASSWLL